MIQLSQKIRNLCDFQINSKLIHLEFHVKLNLRLSIFVPSKK